MIILEEYLRNRCVVVLHFLNNDIITNFLIFNTKNYNKLQIIIPVNYNIDFV